MNDEECFATRAALRQILGRLKGQYNNRLLPARVRWSLDDAIKHTENALKTLREEPTSAAG